MDRRSFLKTTGAVAGAAATGTAGLSAESLAAPVFARGRRNIRLVLAWPSELPGYGTAVQRLTHRIQAASDGGITISLSEPDGTGPGGDPAAAVAAGAADACFGFAHRKDGLSAVLGLFSGVPSGLGPDRLRAWIQFGGGQRAWDEVAAPHGLKPLVAGSTAASHGLWSRRPIASEKDLQGLVIAISGLPAQVASRLGAKTIAPAGGSLAELLRSGTVEAVEGLGPMADLMLGLPGAARYYHPLGFQTGGALLSLGFSRRLWDSFAPSERALIESAALAETAASKAEFEAHGAMAMATIEERYGTSIVLPSPSFLEAVAMATETTLVQLAAADDGAHRAISSYRGFLRATARQSGPVVA